jgi:hypothetical protein
MKFYRNFTEIYSCTVILVYSTSLLIFFWELRSLFLRFPFADIIGFLSYQFAFALLESVIIAAIILLLVSLIPLYTVRKYPSAAGFLLALSLAISGLIYKLRTPIIDWFVLKRISDESAASYWAFLIWFSFLCILPVVSILLAKNEKIAFRIQHSLDHLSVLAIVYTFLGILGLIIVIYRNLV